MGKMQVSHNFQEVQPTFVLRSFTIENMDTGEARDVIQYAYTAWPDHGVPNTTKELLQFRYEMMLAFNVAPILQIKG